MIERYSEHDPKISKRRAVALGSIGLVVLMLGLGLAATPAYAQDPTPPPVQVTVEVVIPTPVPTHTPTPIPTVDPGVIQYSGPGETVDWSVENVVTWTTTDYDFGCPFSYSTEATGNVTVCIAYTEITGWSMIGVDIPFWPFTGALALVIVGWLVRR